MVTSRGSNPLPGAREYHRPSIANKQRLARKVENTFQLRALHCYLSVWHGPQPRIELIHLKCCIEAARRIATEHSPAGRKSGNHFHFCGIVFFWN